MLSVSLNVECIIESWVDRKAINLNVDPKIQTNLSHIQQRRVNLLEACLNVGFIVELDMHFRFATLNDDQDVQMNVPYIQQHRVNLLKMRLKVKATVTSLIWNDE